jgi:Fic family protein
VLTLPTSDLFVFMYVRKESVPSSKIEGTQSSLQDLLAAEAQVLDPERPHEEFTPRSRGRRDVAGARSVAGQGAKRNHGLGSCRG